MNLDLNPLTDESLDALRRDVLNEQERRQRLATIPAQVTGLVSRYVADGGDVADVQAKIAEALEPPTALEQG